MGTQFTQKDVRTALVGLTFAKTGRKHLPWEATFQKGEHRVLEIGDLILKEFFDRHHVMGMGRTIHGHFITVAFAEEDYQALKASGIINTNTSGQLIYHQEGAHSPISLRK